MPKMYFLDGLGSNRYYVTPLKEAFAAQGLDLIYLPLPGHPEHLESSVRTLDDLLTWFEGAVTEEKVTLMGFSLGADLGSYLAYRSPKVTRLILLDGGLVDVTKAPLDKELEAARRYLEDTVVDDLEHYIADQAFQNADWTTDLEQAERYAFCKVGDCYRLNLNPEMILTLLRLRYEACLTILQPDYQTPTLAIVASSPQSLLVEKQATLAKASKDFVSSLILPKTSHNLYREAPDKIALATRFFVEAF